MVHVPPKHTDWLRFPSTFLASPGRPLSQEREFYLAMETGPLLNTVLTQLQKGIGK